MAESKKDFGLNLGQRVAVEASDSGPGAVGTVRYIGS